MCPALSALATRVPTAQLGDGERRPVWAGATVQFGQSANGSANEMLSLADRIGSADSVTATSVSLRQGSPSWPGFL